MVIFHLCFNLQHFKFIDINIYSSPFWHYFRYTILSIFLLCVGISLYLANKNNINYEKVLKRFALLFIASLAITLVTYFIFPNTWIYFGVLHFIALASIFGLLFVAIPRTSLFLGIVIILAWNLDIISMHWLYDFTREIIDLPRRTEDLVPFTPWFGVVLIGIYIGVKEAFIFNIKQYPVVKTVALFGKHSLFIYLVHQPILFGSIFLAHQLLH